MGYGAQNAVAMTSWRIMFGGVLAPWKRVLDSQPSSLLLGDVIIWQFVPIQGRQRLSRRTAPRTASATDSLTFDVRRSEVALPDRLDSGELDLVFIDGCHGFPSSIIDWFYAAGRLRREGVVVFDDVQLPHVSLLIESFIEPDDRWQELETTPKWRAYRRMSEGFLGEEWFVQPFFPAQKVKHHKRTLKDAVPLKVRKKLARALRREA